MQLCNSNANAAGTDEQALGAYATGTSSCDGSAGLEGQQQQQQIRSTRRTRGTRETRGTRT
eukprot:1931264-Amphidinium_carterae.1